MPKPKDAFYTAIKEISTLLKDSLEQLEILSEYAVDEKDKKVIKELVSLISPSKHFDEKYDQLVTQYNIRHDHNIPTVQQSCQSIEQGLEKVQSMRFQGKGGTKEESEFLSDVVYRVVRFVFDALNLLISLATFGQTNKFFVKTPSVEELKLITEKKGALTATHAEIKDKLDKLPEAPDDGLIHDAP